MATTWISAERGWVRKWDAATNMASAGFYPFPEAPGRRAIACTGRYLFVAAPPGKDGLVKCFDTYYDPPKLVIENYMMGGDQTGLLLAGVPEFIEPVSALRAIPHPALPYTGIYAQVELDRIKARINGQSAMDVLASRGVQVKTFASNSICDIPEYANKRGLLSPDGVRKYEDLPAISGQTIFIGKDAAWAVVHETFHQVEWNMPAAWLDDWTLRVYPNVPKDVLAPYERTNHAECYAESGRRFTNGEPQPHPTITSFFNRMR